MRVLVTRAEDQGRATGARLEAAGLDGVMAPLTRIVLDGDVALPLDGVQAVVVTSLNGVTALAVNDAADRLRALPLFAVGDKTAAAARARGFTRVTSAGKDRTALADLLGHALDPAAGALLWAAGADRTAGFAEVLETAGFEVRIAELYRAEAVSTLPDEVAADLAGGRIDAVAVYSPRSAEILVDALAARGFSPASSRFRIHAISEAAAAPLRRAGYDRIVVAETPDESGLLVTFVQSRAAPPAGEGAEPGRSHMAPEKKTETETGPEAVAKETETTPVVVDAAPETTETAEPAADTPSATDTAAEGPPDGEASEPAATTEAAEATTAEPARPLAAEPPPAPEMPPPVAPVRPGVGGGTVIVAMLAAALGGGALGVGLPHWVGPKLDALLGPAAPDPALKAALDRLATLEAKLADDEKKAAEAKPVDLAPLEKRLAAVEQAPALKLPADLADRVSTLQKEAEERLAAAKTSISESLAKLPAGDPDALATLAARVDAAIAAARESAAARIAALSSELDATRAELKTRGGDAASTALAAVDQQKASLAAALEAMRQRLGSLEGLRAEVDGLVGRMGGVETSNAEAKVDRGRITQALDQTLEATEGRVGLVESKVAEMEAGASAAAKAQSEAVFAVALADLKSAVDAGRPFGPELEVVKRAAPEGAPSLAVLDGFAKTGVPSVTKLREDLPKVGRAMIEADEAATAGTGFFERMVSHAATLVRIRPAGETAGESIGARVSRVEGRLTAGDLPGAFAAWKALPETARKASAAWGTALEARVTVDGALATATSAIVSKLSTPAK